MGFGFENVGIRVMISYVGKEANDFRRGSPEKTERNAEIVALRGLGKSFRQLAVQFGVDPSRIVQIVKRANASPTSEFFARPNSLTKLR